MEQMGLERQLAAAQSNEQWVEILARLFDAHRLVYGHGTDNAADEAYWLIRHVQGWSEERWRAPPTHALAGRTAAIARERVERRIPLAYLLGAARFAGLDFEVDERVLVPRSPLAEVIERGFAPWCELVPGDRVLDIGTGSGCLAIAAAHYRPGVLVDATDISGAALEVAAANVARHGLEARVRLHQADLFPSGAAGYRVIMSNPPYVPTDEVAALPPEHAAEPRGALDGGATGFALVDEILRGAPSALAPEGILIVEIGAGVAAFERAWPRLPVTWLELERGGDGVFLISAAELREHGL